MQEHLKEKAQDIYNEVLFQSLKFALRESPSDSVFRKLEREAIEYANECVGKNWTQRLEKAAIGEMDLLSYKLERESLERAKLLLELTLKNKK